MERLSALEKLNGIYKSQLTSKRENIMYNYRNSKSNIINILKSKTPVEKRDNIPTDDKEFTYSNGFLCWTSALFVDIKDSSKLFDTKDEKLARLMRAFTSEIITILQGDSNDHNQIGIRGDCVYGIYSTPNQEDLFKIFNRACLVNAFMKMFNVIIKDYGYNPIVAGIGLGLDEELIIKAGRTGTGINDKIWIGKAVVDASNLSSRANRNNIDEIAMSTMFYDNVKDILLKENEEYRNWIACYPVSNRFNGSTVEFYYCNIINVDMNNWIDGGMKGD